MNATKCYMECPWYESEYTYEEERAPGCYETVGEPPTCRYGSEPYSDTAPGWTCPHGIGA